MRLALLLSLFSMSALSYAQPAPFYLWQSKTSGHLSCSQTSLGDGWTRFAGPFKDAGCRKIGRP